MQTIDDEALVLDSHRYGDRHLILSLLTRSSGAQRAVLRRARGGKAPLASAAQVLSRVHVSLAQRPHAELADCRHLDLIMSSFPLAAELTASAAAAVVAELLATFCPAGEPDERAYRLGVSCLEALLGKVAPDLVVAYSQYWMLNLGGVLPEADAITAAVGAAGADYLSGFRRRPVADIGATPPSRTAQWLDRRVREEAERPLRALAFLRQLSE